MRYAPCAIALPDRLTIRPRPRMEATPCRMVLTPRRRTKRTRQFQETEAPLLGGGIAR